MATRKHALRTLGKTVIASLGVAAICSAFDFLAGKYGFDVAALWFTIPAIVLICVVATLANPDW